jgi:hypothetical protein
VVGVSAFALCWDRRSEPSPDKQAAVEEAAQEFKTEIWRLYAVARR